MALEKASTIALVLLVLACNSKTKSDDHSLAQAPATTSAAPAAAAPSAAAPAPAPTVAAQIGAPAPDFELAEVDGQKVRLSQFRGKTVVLEWFNPDCPFVRKSHTKGSLVGTAARHTQAGVVWLAINSGAPGKQGHGAERNRQAKQEYQLSHPILLDEDGQVGKTYGAKRTPTLFVVDAQGVLVYAGAIDNSPDAEGESPEGNKLVNYVDDALKALSAKKPVEVPRTEAYGCTVKYGS